MDDSKEVLRTLTGKKNIVFTSRGNTSILATLKYAKNKGYSTILIQDQGGWMTYPQYISRLKLNEVRLTTNYGLINLDELKNYKDVVLIKHKKLLTNFWFSLFLIFHKYQFIATFWTLSLLYLKFASGFN